MAAWILCDDCHTVQVRVPDGPLPNSKMRCPACEAKRDPRVVAVERGILAKVYTLECETCGDACSDPDADEGWLVDLIAAHLGDHPEGLVEDLYARVCDDLRNEDRWPNCEHCAYMWGKDC